MVKKWEEMSAKERQEADFKRWTAGEDHEFKSPEAKKKYQKRITLIKDVVQ